MPVSHTASVESQPLASKFLNGTVPNGNVSHVPDFTVKTELKTDVSKSESRPYVKDQVKSTSTLDRNKHK